MTLPGPIGLGYGLCWRKELNWQFMCWEYRPVTEEGTDSGQDCRKDSEKYSAEGTCTVDNSNTAKSAKGRRPSLPRGILPELEYKGQDQDDEDLDIEYWDEKDGEYYRLEGDEDLDIALERNEKLTLAVKAPGP